MNSQSRQTKISRRSNRYRNQGKIYWLVNVVVVVVLLLGIFHMLPEHTQITVTEALSAPFAQSNPVRPLGSISTYFKSDAGLRAENERLREELRASQALEMQVEALRMKNDRLSIVLGAGIKPNFVYADVIANGRHSPYNTTLIDVGVNDSVTPGDVVYFQTTIPVGVVVDAREHSSLVHFFSHPAQQIPIFIGKGKERVRTKASGIGGGTLTVVLPAGTTVAEGDVVQFLGSTSAEPIGRVGQLESQGGSFTTAYLKLAVDPSTILHLQVQLDAEQ